MTTRAVGAVAAHRVAALDAAVRDHRTLEHVVRWAVAEGVEIADVVTMDEYTHDVLVALPDGLVLVFDTT